MSPQLLGGGIFAILASIVGFDKCTDIVNDQLSKGGISGQLDLPWYCEEDLPTTPNPTPENFELMIRAINKQIAPEPTAQSPVSWVGEKLMSVVDWGGEKVDQINSITNLAFMFVLLIIILMMLMIASIVFAMIYVMFRCCFWCFPIRKKKKKDPKPEVSLGDVKQLMAAVQMMAGGEDAKQHSKKTDVDPELDQMEELARLANNPEAMNTLFKAFSQSQEIEENQRPGKKFFKAFADAQDIEGNQRHGRRREYQPPYNAFAETQDIEGNQCHGRMRDHPMLCNAFVETQDIERNQCNGRMRDHPMLCNAFVETHDVEENQRRGKNRSYPTLSVDVITEIQDDDGFECVHL